MTFIKKTAMIFIAITASLLALTFLPGKSVQAATKPSDVISKITKLEPNFKNGFLEQTKQFSNTLAILKGLMENLNKYEELAYSRGGSFRGKSKDIKSCINGYNDNINTAVSILERFIKRKFIFTNSSTIKAAKELLKLVKDLPNGKTVCNKAYMNGRKNAESKIRNKLKTTLENIKKAQLGSNGSTAKSWLKKTFNITVNAYCVCFYNYCLYSAGYKLWNTNNYQLTGVGYIRDEFKKYGCLKDASNYSPSTGDLAVINKGQHVGMVIKSGSKTYILHGNWSGGKVCYTEIKANNMLNSSDKVTYYGNIVDYLLG